MANVASVRARGWSAGCLLAAALCAAGCTAASATPPAEVPDSSAAASGDPLARASSARRWTDVTASPRPAEPGPDDQRLLHGCKLADAGLMRVAERLAEHQASTLAMLDNDEVGFEMRAAGVPHVWPRAWAMVGDASSDEAATAVSTWLDSFDDGGERRCGVGRAESAMGQVVAVVALDAVADLSEVPRRAHLGQWLEVRAELLAPATDVEVVVLGPRGAPRRAPSTLRGSAVSARVLLDQAGPWLVQVLPTLPGGPRPAAEALVFVEEEPPDAFRASAVPGETAPSTGSSDEAALLAMLNAARQSEGLRSLRHDPQLDVAAKIHARAMQEQGRVAHDLGAGSPADRIAALGLSPSIAGENVARAQSPLHAHRALWASPSHRGNMLLPHFTEVGIGVVRGEDDSVWVCEVFAGF